MIAHLRFLATVSLCTCVGADGCESRCSESAVVKHRKATVANEDVLAGLVRIEAFVDA